MPVYVYELLDTGDRFEIVQSMKDPALTAHPETGDPIRRVILSPNLGLKIPQAPKKNACQTKASPKPVSPSTRKTNSPENITG